MLTGRMRSLITASLSTGMGRVGVGPASVVTSGYCLISPSIHVSPVRSAAASGHFEYGSMCVAVGQRKPPPVTYALIASVVVSFIVRR